LLVGGDLGVEFGVEVEEFELLGLGLEGGQEGFFVGEVLVEFALQGSEFVGLQEEELLA
jgi:hypothetical protein